MKDTLTKLIAMHLRQNDNEDIHQTDRNTFGALVQEFLFELLEQEFKPMQDGKSDNFKVMRGTEGIIVIIGTEQFAIPVVVKSVVKQPNFEYETDVEKAEEKREAQLVKEREKEAKAKEREAKALKTKVTKK